MQSFLLLLFSGVFLGACIWFLHRIQRRRTVETADRAAPLPALDDGQVPDFGGGAPVASSDNNWLAQIRSLRESGQLDAALSQSKAHFPKTQAFQQAAIILRQQIREGLDHFQPVDALLVELFHTAALADLFRTSSSHKPLNPQAALDAVRNLSFHYAAIGHLRLKLLNKSDVRALEQLWGDPGAHRHVEEVLGEDWLKWCRPPA
jgi:cbb3-type cytochrome oxidase subunit 3